MKRIATVALLACLAVPGTTLALDKSELTTFKQKLSYSMGLDMGTYLNSIREELDYDILAHGIKSGFDGGKSILTPEEMKVVHQQFADKMKEKQDEALKELQVKNKQDGDAFMAENKKKKGVIVTDSGIQYEVVEKGKGKSPKVSDTVTVHYTGTTIDGNVFDDSSKRGQPAVFAVGQVIPGWTEVLQLMKEGAKYHVVIPPALAYGERGVPPMIGPDSVLIFDINLISVKEEDSDNKDSKK